MNAIAKIVSAALLISISFAAPADANKPGTPKAPHACKSHSVKVVASKCADRNGDGIIEQMPDGTTR